MDVTDGYIKEIQVNKNNKTIKIIEVKTMNKTNKKIITVQ